MNKAQTKCTDLHSLKEQLRVFVQERNWEQFHTPKNLATALSVEASELLEPFQWLQTGEFSQLDDKTYEEIAYEMADVLNYLVMLADRLNVDLLEVAHKKIKMNAIKYPIELSKGLAKKR